MERSAVAFYALLWLVDHQERLVAVIQRGRRHFDIEHLRARGDIKRRGVADRVVHPKFLVDAELANPAVRPVPIFEISNR